MVLVWSSLFYVEAGQDVRLQYAAKLITGALAVVGAAFAIGVGMILGQNEPPALGPSSAGEIPIARSPMSNFVKRLDCCGTTRESGYSVSCLGEGGGGRLLGRLSKPY
jgi:hypothetical protein